MSVSATKWNEIIPRATKFYENSLIEREKMIGTLEEERKLFKLTKREKEICYYLKKGYTYKKIAETLFISINTVNKHVKNIYQKTGVNNRTVFASSAFRVAIIIALVT